MYVSGWCFVAEAIVVTRELLKVVTLVLVAVLTCCAVTILFFINFPCSFCGSFSLSIPRTAAAVLRSPIVVVVVAVPYVRQRIVVVAVMDVAAAVVCNFPSLISRETFPIIVSLCREGKKKRRRKYGQI